MNPDLIFEILQIALRLLQANSTGKVQQDEQIAQSLLQIGQKVKQAYEAQTGLPLDVSLIKAENPIN